MWFLPLLSFLFAPLSLSLLCTFSLVIGCGRWPIYIAVKGSSVQLPKETDKLKEKQLFQRHEWLGRFLRFRNDVLIVFSIICLQFPFELAYAYLYEVIKYDLLK